jgi:hypothetical protein
MSGEPIEEPVIDQGSFVTNSWAEIQKAFETFKSGGWEISSSSMKIARRPRKTS